MLYKTPLDIIRHANVKTTIYLTIQHIYKEHYLFFPDPDWIRTNDPSALPAGRQVRRLMLYPAELPDQFCVAKL